jgi:hypothetical protein
MAGVFYLTHRVTLDASDLWRLANRWESVEKYVALFAYIDQWEVHHDELFLPQEEFINLAKFVISRKLTQARSELVLYVY